MASVNKTIIVGNLGADPETRYLPSGDPVCNIRVATTDKYKDKASGEVRESTEWHRIVFFNRLAEIADEYLRKGAQVYVEGRLKTRQWEKDGVKQYSTEIVAETMQMLGGRRDDEGGRNEGENRQRSNSSNGNGNGQRQQRGNNNGNNGNEYRNAREGRAPQGRAPNNGFEDMDDDIPF